MDIKDLEKGIQEAIGAPDAQIPPMAGEEEKERLLISDLLHHDPADWGVTAANMNPTRKNKSLRCWLVVAGTVMFLTNYIQAAPKYQLIPLEPMVIFMMFMCAIFNVFCTMKQI